MKKVLVLGIIVMAYVGLNMTTATACTIFTFLKGDTVLFGNNEDYYNRSDVIYFVPSDGESYGAVYLGQRYTDRYNPQGGMNEVGLAFDANAIPEARLNDHPELSQPGTWLAVMMMDECATVEEAVEMAGDYSWGASMAYQLHLADATGDAVVIGPGPDGEIAFTRIGGEGYLVSTNFNLADPGDGPETCWRYMEASAMLDELEAVDDPAHKDVSGVLEAVAQRGGDVNTVYSNVFDTRRQVAYIYYFHQFDEAVAIDLHEELEKGFHHEVIGQLFTQETRDKARAAMSSYTQAQRETSLAFLGGVSLLVSFAVTAVVAAVFLRSPRSEENDWHGNGDPSVGFDWRGFFKPSVLKLVIALILPPVVAAVVTRRAESVFDFYGYLLTPRLALWTGEGIVYVFNRWLLLWIPFYLAACALVYIAGRRFPRSQPHKGEDGQSPS